MSTYRSANSFASGFMQGYSFIDDAKRAKRDESRLEDRLEQERQDRERRLFMQEDAFKRANEMHDLNVENEMTRRDDIKKQKEASALWASGDELTDEQITEYAPYSPDIMNEMNRRRNMARTTGAMRDAQTIGQAPQVSQGLSAGAAGVSAAGVSAAGVSAAGMPVAAAGAPGAEADAESGLAAGQEEVQSAFAPGQGSDAMVRIGVDEARQFDERFQEKRWVAKQADIVGGRSGGLASGIMDVVATPFRAAERGIADIRGYEPVTNRGNAGADVAGDIYVPADKWTTREQFNAIQDPAEREKAAQRNQQVMVEYHEISKRTSGNALQHNRTASVRNASAEQLARAQRFEEKAVSTFSEMVSNPASSQLQQMAAENPAAGAAEYFQMRNTVKAANPELAAQVDSMMLPVLNRYTQELHAEIDSHPAGSLQANRATQRLAAVQKSQNEIAASQPSISQQAGINAQGLKIGDQTRGDQFIGAVFNPNRPAPVPGTVPGSTINSALTVAGRITPGTTRLNQRQLESMVTLADAGLIDQSTMMAVVSTGHWPPGQDPNAIKSIMSHGDYAFALTHGGGIRVIASTRKGKPDEGSIPSQEMTAEVLNSIVAGAKVHNPNMSEETENAIKKLALNNAGFVREEYILSSEEHRLKLGATLHDSLFLAKQNEKDNYHSGFTLNPFDWMRPHDKHAPSASDVFMSKPMREGMAKQYDVQLVGVPNRIVEGEGIDWEEARQSVRGGDLVEYGIYPAEADDMNDDMMAYVVMLLNGDPETIRALHAEAKAERQ